MSRTLVHPGSWEYQWVASVVAAVAHRIGVPTRWNGQLFEDPDLEDFGGAGHDGHLIVSGKHVLGPLLDAYQGKELTNFAWMQLRNAVLTVVHEAGHLSSRLGDPAAPGAVPHQDPAARALEEGLMEAWAQRYVDVIISDIGMDRQVPAVLGAYSNNPYQVYTGAVDTAIHGLARLTANPPHDPGIPPDQLRRILHAAERTQRFNVLAEVLIDRRLSGLMPAEHRETIRFGLAVKLRTQFAQLTSLQQNPRLDDTFKADLGRRIGQAAVNDVAAALDHDVRHYRGWYQRQAAQQAAQQPARQPAQQPMARPRTTTSRKGLGIG